MAAGLVPFSSARVADSPVYTVAWPSASTLVTGGEGGALKTWTLSRDATKANADTLNVEVLRAGVTVAGAHLGGVISLTVAGERAISVGANRELTVWKVTETDLQKLASTKGGDGASGASYRGVAAAPSSSSSSSALLIAAGDARRGAVHILRMREGGGAAASSDLPSVDHISSISTGRTSSSFPVMCVAFSPDGKTVAAGHSDGSVSLLDAQAGALLGAIDAHQLCVRSICFSADGKEVFSASDDGRIGVFDVGAVPSITSSTITSTSTSGSSSSSQTHHAPFPLVAYLTGHLGSVSSVCAGPADKPGVLLSGSSDGSVKLWDARKRDCIHTFEGLHGGTVWGLALAPETQARKVVSVAESGTLEMHALGGLI